MSRAPRLVTPEVFEPIRPQLGISHRVLDDLRHTAAAWLVTAGVSLAEVRDLLGHASITMTERYAHLSPENVRAAVRKLDLGHDFVTLSPRSVEHREENHR